MGDGAEDALARRHPEVFGGGRRRPRELPPRQLSHLDVDSRWITADGEVMKLEDMTPRHRGNVVAMLIRKNGPWVESTPLVKRMRQLGTEDHNI